VLPFECRPVCKSVLLTLATARSWTTSASRPAISCMRLFWIATARFSMALSRCRASSCELCGAAFVCRDIHRLCESHLRYTHAA
jgi:hypothetical protein